MDDQDASSIETVVLRKDIKPALRGHMECVKHDEFSYFEPEQDVLEEETDETLGTFARHTFLKSIGT